jgi:hypothetical protein
MDRAIADWAVLYSAFNQDQPVGGDTNTINLTISAANLASVPPIFGGIDNALGVGGPGAPTPSQPVPPFFLPGSNDDGTPRTGNVTMDDDASGIGWYFDSDISNDGDFPNIGSSIWQASNPAITTIDFYSVALHEVGHAIGFFDGRIPNPPSPLPATPDWGITSRQSDTGINDNQDDNGRDIINFNGSGYTATFTESHLYGASGQPAPNGGPIHTGYLMNWSIARGTRLTISDIEASILRDGYGYTRSSTNVNTMAIRLDKTARTLLANSDPQSANDQFKIDLINLGNTVRIQLNGHVEDFAASDLDRINLTLDNGTNEVLIFNLNKPITITGGTGSDLVDVSASAGNLDGISAQVSFVGGLGTGTDSVILRDDGPGTTGLNDTYTITFNQLTRDFFGGLRYSGVEQIELRGQRGNNTFNINSTDANRNYSFFGSEGNDAFVVGNGSWMALAPTTGDPASRRINLNSGSGVDTVTINDINDPASDSDIYLQGDVALKTQTGNSTRRAADIAYTGHEALVFNGGSGRQFIRVDWTRAGVATTVNANNGDDEVWLGWNGGNLADIQGSVTVQGGAGSDRVVAYDDFQTDNAVFNVTQSSISHAGAASINLGAHESIAVESGSGNDTVYLQSLTGSPVLQPIAFTWNARGGDDGLWLANAGGDVGVIDGPVSFNGGEGTDRMFFDDDNNASGVGYIVGAGTVFRTDGPFGLAQVPFSHSAVDEIYVYGPQGNNSFTFNGVTQNVRYEVYANNGNDTLTVGNDLDSNFPSNTIAGRVVQFFGQGGTDAVFINDSADTSADGASFGADFQDIRIDVTRKYSSDVGLPTTTEIRFSEHESIEYTGAAHRTVYALRQTTILTTLRAGNGDDEIRVGDGNAAANAANPPLIDGQGGTDLVILVDDGVAGPGVYSIFGSTISFSDNSFAPVAVEDVQINGSQGVDSFSLNSSNYSSYAFVGNSGNDTFDIHATQVGSIVVAIGGNNDDTLRISPLSRNVDSVGGEVVFVGDAGSNTAELDNRNAAGASQGAWFNISSSIVDRESGSPFGELNYANVQNLRVFGSGGSKGFNVNSLPASTALTLTTGNDDSQVIFGAANRRLDLVDGPVQINHTGAALSLRFDDTDNSNINSTYTLGTTQFTASQMGGVSWTLVTGSLMRVDLFGASTNNTVNVNQTVPSSIYDLRGNGGVDTFNINETLGIPNTTQGAPRLIGGPGLDVLNINSNGFGSASAVIGSPSDDFASVTIGAGGYLGIEPSGGAVALISNSISISPGGQLDLNDNAAILNYTGTSPIETVEQLVRDGRMRKGVNSAVQIDASAQLGTAEASDFGGSAFLGVPVDSTSVLIRYTRLGDANLDRSVNFADLLVLAQNYGLAGRRWSQGSFDYDLPRRTEFADLLILAQHYGQSAMQMRPTTSRFGTTRMGRGLTGEVVV